MLYPGAKGIIQLSRNDEESAVVGIEVLYTDYIYFFQASGMVLLVAMIGAIVLTLRHKPGVRRQVIMDQVLRTPKSGMRVVSLKPGEGIPSFAEATEGQGGASPSKLQGSVEG